MWEGCLWPVWSNSFLLRKLLFWGIITKQCSLNTKHKSVLGEVNVTWLAYVQNLAIFSCFQAVERKMSSKKKKKIFRIYSAIMSWKLVEVTDITLNSNVRLSSGWTKTKQSNWYQIIFNVENECHIATNTNSFEPLRCHSLIVPWMICHRKQDKQQPCPLQTHNQH